jgi:hypothetical protein
LESNSATEYSFVLELCSTLELYISFIFAEKNAFYSANIKEVIILNLKLMVISHWRVALLLLLLTWLTVRIISGIAFAEAIDCPGGG